MKLSQEQIKELSEWLDEAIDSMDTFAGRIERTAGNARLHNEI